MKAIKYFALLLVIVVLCLMVIEPAFAGPGGKIARVMFETFWGRVLLAVLTIVLLPFILYVMIKEKIGERRARKDLRIMAKYDRNFEWMNIKQRASDCFYRVHAAWKKEDVSEAAEFMTSWYWQNQQMVFLDRWEKEGLVNHCTVKRISGIRPLFFAHRSDSAPHEGSLLAISITATVQDYLAERGTGKVVEGSKKFKPVETIWSFALLDGKWKVSGIEEGDMALVYAKEMLDRPVLDEKVMADVREKARN